MKASCLIILCSSSLPSEQGALTSREVWPTGELRMRQVDTSPAYVHYISSAFPVFSCLQLNMLIHSSPLTPWPATLAAPPSNSCYDAAIACTSMHTAPRLLTTLRLLSRFSLTHALPLWSTPRGVDSSLPFWSQLYRVNTPSFWNLMMHLSSSFSGLTAKLL